MVVQPYFVIREVNFLDHLCGYLGSDECGLIALPE